MMVRKCPVCKERNYSGDATGEYWRCHNCGVKINIEFQQPAGVEEAVGNQDIVQILKSQARKEEEDE